MAVNKVVFGNTTIMDISDSTVTADSMLTGTRAYGANGVAITGTISGMTQEEASAGTSTDPKLISAKVLNDTIEEKAGQPPVISIAEIDALFDS